MESWRLSYPPVGYVIIKHMLPDYKWHEDTAFFHDYDKAVEHCKEKNNDPAWNKHWYFEPNEVDILD